MRLHTYQADSMAAALARVKRELGSAAVIVHTRSFRRGGLFGWRGRNIVEITATVEPRVLDRVRPRAAPVAVTPVAETGSVAVAEVDIEPIQRRIEHLEPTPRPSAPTKPGRLGAPAASLPLTPAESFFDPAAMLRELSAVRELVGQVLRESRTKPPGPVPQELTEHYTRLISQSVADELAREIVNSLQPRDPAGSMKTAIDPVSVDAELRRVIEQMLPTADPLELGPSGETRIVALVGATGVGKTTTAAKLAAHFKLREQRRVGLITLDTYRIAAVEQLRVYANILDVPLMVVRAPQEMADAVQRLRSQQLDLVLIDTAGRSQRDGDRIGELQQFLDAAQPLDTHLVLSGAASEAVALDTVRQFAQLKPQRIIFTKLDEAVGLGLILNVMSNVGLRVSYLTTGQSVPNDLEVGHASRIAELILDGMPARGTGFQPVFAAQRGAHEGMLRPVAQRGAGSGVDMGAGSV